MKYCSVVKSNKLLPHIWIYQVAFLLIRNQLLNGKVMISLKLSPPHIYLRWPAPQQLSLYFTFSLYFIYFISWKHYAKWFKSNTKGYILYWLIYMTFHKRKLEKENSDYYLGQEVRGDNLLQCSARGFSGLGNILHLIYNDGYAWNVERVDLTVYKLYLVNVCLNW